MSIRNEASREVSGEVSGEVAGTVSTENRVSTEGSASTDGGRGTGDGRLILVPNIEDGDGFYDELLQAHEGLDEAASHALDARLILILCNHVGDRGVIREALAAARASASRAVDATDAPSGTPEPLS